MKAQSSSFAASSAQRRRALSGPCSAATVDATATSRPRVPTGKAFRSSGARGNASMMVFLLSVGLGHVVFSQIANQLRLAELGESFQRRPSRSEHEYRACAFPLRAVVTRRDLPREGLEALARHDGGSLSLHGALSP